MNRRRGRSHSYVEKRDLVYLPGSGLIFTSGDQALVESAQNGAIGNSAPLLLSPDGQIVPQSPTSVPLLSDDGSPNEPTNKASEPPLIQPAGETSSNIAGSLMSLELAPMSLPTSAIFGTSQSPETTISASAAIISSGTSVSLFSVTSPLSVLISSNVPPPTTSLPLSQTSISPIPSSSKPAGAAAFTASSSSATSLVTHRNEVAIGIAFAVIIGVASLIAFVSWFLRSRYRHSGCFGKRDDDVEDRTYDLSIPDSWWDASLEKNSTLSDDAKKQISDAREQLDIQNNYAERPNRFTGPSVTFSLPPTNIMRPPIIHLQSAESVSNQPAANLGKLQVTNLLPGDYSGTETSRPTSRIGAISDPPESADKSPKRHPLGPQFGTPREAVAGSTLRFKAVEGRGLPVPWITSERTGIISIRGPGESADEVRPVAVRQGSQETCNDFPPLPFPESLRSGPASEDTLDSWGASLRNSLMSALSAVTGHPSRPSMSNPSIDVAEEALDNNVSLGGNSPSAFNILGGSQMPGLGISVPSEKGGDIITDEIAKEESTLTFASTSPLIIKKKSLAASFHVSQTTYKLSETDMPSTSPSRSSSIYSCATNQRFESRNGTPAQSRSPSKYVKLRSGVRTSQLKREVLLRPAFLKRASSRVSATSLKSAWSNASDDTEKQALARRTMMLRERRRKNMTNGRRAKVTDDMMETAGGP